ncbi:signal peptidase I [Nostoc sp. B(2019)]|nr:signal peptidase I [Nostoc sp. B(2019)]
MTIALLVMCLAIIAFLRFNFTITTVHGDSMYPTLREGDRLLSLNLLPRLWLRKGQIVIGDINSLELPSSSEAFADIDIISEPDFAFDSLSESDVENLPFQPDCGKFIKRIIGLPGDTVCISISSLHEFMQTILRSAEGSSASRSRCDSDGNLICTVPENHCFVRGDGLVSMDSLIVGPIPLSALTGIALMKLPRRLDIDTVHLLREASDV